MEDKFNEEDRKEDLQDKNQESKVEEVGEEDQGKKSSNKKLKITIGILSFLIIALIGTMVYLNRVLNTTVIYEGIKIEDVNVGKKSKKDALSLLKKKKLDDIKSSNMELSYGEKIYNINVEELGFFYKYEEAIEQAYKEGRSGKKIDRLKKIRQLKKSGKKIELESDFDREKAATIIGPIMKDINKDKVEATFDFNGGDFKVTEHSTGRQVDQEKLKEMINNNVYELKPIEIPVETLQPVRTKEALTRINGLIGTFSTKFANSIPGRKENIRISAEAVERRGVIMPGEVVSFNQLTGDRSRANGYKEAVVIEEGNYTDGVGGGVCQTSTTLYNALIRADIGIVARGPHSIPARYVPFGQDAAVAYDYLDLKYKNNFEAPIYIKANYSGNSLTFNIYGDLNVKDYGVHIDSEIVETIPSKTEEVLDKSLAPGSREVVQGGRQGYKVNTYRSYVRNGEKFDRKMITKDYYRPKNTIYRVGPKSVPTEDTTEE